MKIGLIISTNDSETVWNAFRLANVSLTKKDGVKIFLLGKGVEAEQIGTEQFDVKKQMQSFVSAGGQILACGTCLRIRNAGGSDLCPISTMADLYEMINEADKVLTF
ncbi:MAG TPA: DsrE family protein [Bacteroidota bacterium]|nr:DsrE family protein [Bacteroidota bacterium]